MSLEFITAYAKICRITTDGKNAATNVATMMDIVFVNLKPTD